MLCYRHAGTSEVDAICATLDYASVPYTETVDPHLAHDVELHIGAGSPLLGDDDDKDGVVLAGWSVVFLYASRLAHTLPSRPLHMAMCLQSLRLVESESLAAMEARLRDHVSSPWLCDELLESTAADFLFIHRLRRLRAHEGVSFERYPRLHEYMDQDPTRASCNYVAAAPNNCVVS